mgnify:FL=1
MKQTVIRTLLKFVVAVNVAILLTVTYDLFTFTQKAVERGIRMTPEIIEVLFQWWFFGASSFYAAWIPLLILVGCLIAFRIGSNNEEN